MMQQWLSAEFTLTKRHLGIIFVLVGLVLLGGVLGVDVLRSQPVTLGAFQKLGMALGVLIVGAGMLLLPLGNRPA